MLDLSYGFNDYCNSDSAFSSDPVESEPNIALDVSDVAESALIPSEIDSSALSLAEREITLEADSDIPAFFSIDNLDEATDLESAAEVEGGEDDSEEIEESEHDEEEEIEQYKGLEQPLEELAEGAEAPANLDNLLIDNSPPVNSNLTIVYKYAKLCTGIQFSKEFVKTAMTATILTGAGLYTLGTTSNVLGYQPAVGMSMAAGILATAINEARSIALTVTSHTIVPVLRGATAIVSRNPGMAASYAISGTRLGVAAAGMAAGIYYASSASKITLRALAVTSIAATVTVAYCVYA